MELKDETVPAKQETRLFMEAAEKASQNFDSMITSQMPRGLKLETGDYFVEQKKVTKKSHKPVNPLAQEFRFGK